MNTSKIAEHIITESIGEGGWFGDDVTIILPSLFDDYFRGVDAIAEFAKDKKDPKHMALSMDFTIQKDEIAKKMLRNFEFLQKGVIPSVKYFESPLTGQRKNMWMPKVILSADYDKLQRIKDEYVELTLAGRKDEAKQILGKDPVQLIFLDEIRAQLNAYTKICYEVLNNKRAGDLHKKANEIFLEILAKKGLTPEALKAAGRGDASHQKLISFISKFDR